MDPQSKLWTKEEQIAELQKLASLGSFESRAKVHELIAELQGLDQTRQNLKAKHALVRRGNSLALLSGMLYGLSSVALTDR